MSNSQGVSASPNRGTPKPSASGASLRKACEQCRSRKIRCDGNCPCTQCLQINIACNKAGRQPRAKAQIPATVSARYKEKIDLIDHRLDDITRLLHDISTSIPALNTQPIQSTSSYGNQANSTAQSLSSADFNRATKSTVNNTDPEIEHSLAVHYDFANDFFHKKSGINRLTDSNDDVKEALESLHCVIKTMKLGLWKHQASFPVAKQVTRPSLPKCELPPIEEVVELIRTAKDHHSSNPLNTVTWVSDFFPLESFSYMCLRVYFSEDASECDRIIANYGLLELFTARSQLETEDPGQSQQYALMCRANLESALADLPLYLPATAEMAVALLLGAIHTMQISKPLLAFSLSSKALELCQTLGYHQLSPSQDGTVSDDVKTKQLLFWMTYLMEKSLSLRVGRSSATQDWDITTPMLSLHEGPSSLDASVALWIDTARCQGNIYKQLYSPEALAQPPDVRQSRVEVLSTELYRLDKKSREISDHHLQHARDKFGQSMIEFLTLSDDVMRASLLTLVYRASPPPKEPPSALTRSCVEAARMTMQRHHEFLVTFKDINPLYLSTYVHWTLNFSPFIPFIVLVCHVIEHCDKGDLERLHDYITSMESNSVLVEAAGRMHPLFKALYEVALRYVECSPSSHDPTYAERNPMLDHLTSLSFPFSGQVNPSEWNLGISSQSVQAGGSSGMLAQEPESMYSEVWSSNTDALEQWLGESQHIMDMFEESPPTFPGPS
ncbi:hypothetical protein AU210_012735 [Fusarium oxysporum f. sp. radicis-cucumerinum]|uniref:Zn(2)-C6 fungal-type domain-containing protein n=1 Tax=Fusarium oxysporum f. sp. radicis-cucumerinum TaxID=327505 RepID=A0A2H3G6N6_FUSOX|nr:hypothetical protein AU210_012735 [Fusarium oxysporum f. sp. radicis-cucumerinum]